MTLRIRTLATCLFAVALPLGAQQAVPSSASAASPALAPVAAPSLVVTAENRTAVAEAARGARRANAAARPGDVLRYQLVFSNASARQVRGVALTNPVPAGLRYVAGSTTASRADAQPEFSIDSGRTWAASPVDVVVVDGRRTERPAAAERYTHVRWTVAGWVQPGTTVTAAFEARVGDAVATKSDSASSMRASSPAQAPRGR
jgi:uncharacterized repeat protein (TIGR01451 family)